MSVMVGSAWLWALLVSADGGAPASAASNAIAGEYLEVRDADLWAPPVAGANKLLGTRAILGWNIKRGEFNGVNLRDRAVAAVIVGDKPIAEAGGKAVIFVDVRANDAQREALVALAKTLAPDAIKEVTAVRATKIFMFRGECDEKGCAMLNAGPISVWTRCICPSDRVKGQDTVLRKPLAKVMDPVGAYTIETEYAENDVPGGSFAHRELRSSQLAQFVWPMK